MTQDELFAREAIRDVIARYNHAGDRGRLDELARCFAEDGAMDLEGVAPLVGRAAIQSHLAGVASRLAARTERATLRHHVSSVRIRLADREHAEAWSCFIAFTEIGLDHWGRYADRLVRRGEEWLFALRKVRVDGSAPGSRMLGGEPGQARLPPRSRRDGEISFLPASSCPPRNVDRPIAPLRERGPREIESGPRRTPGPGRLASPR